MDGAKATNGISFVLWIFGLANIVALIGIARSSQALNGMTPGQAALPLIISCIIFCAAGWGVWKRLRWGRILGIVLLAVSLIMILIGLLGSAGGPPARAVWLDIVVLALDAILLWLLWFNKDVVAQFVPEKAAATAASPQITVSTPRQRKAKKTKR